MPTKIERVESKNKGEFIIYVDEERAGEMTYSRAGEQLIIIEHTRVKEAFRGQGIAGKLLARAVDWARHSDTRVIPHCPFAKAKIDENADYQDVLDD